MNTNEFCVQAYRLKNSVLLKMNNFVHNDFHLMFIDSYFQKLLLLELFSITWNLKGWIWKVWTQSLNVKVVVVELILFMEMKAFLISGLKHSPSIKSSLSVTQDFKSKSLRRTSLRIFLKTQSKKFDGNKKSNDFPERKYLQWFLSLSCRPMRSISIRGFVL